MRHVIAAVLATSIGVARADRIIVEPSSIVEPDPDPEPWPPGAGPMLAAVTIGGSLLTLGGLARGFGDRSDWSTAAVWASLPLLAVGPSIVHFYTGDRAVGAAGVVANTVAFTLFGLAIHHEDVLAARSSPSVRVDTRANVELVGGLTLWAGASVFEIVDTLRVARHDRERLRVVPTGTGVAISGQF